MKLFKILFLGAACYGIGRLAMSTGIISNKHGGFATGWILLIPASWMLGRWLGNVFNDFQGLFLVLGGMILIFAAPVWGGLWTWDKYTWIAKHLDAIAVYLVLAAIGFYANSKAEKSDG